MRWIEDRLEPAEEVIFETRPHWSIFILPILLFGIALYNLWMLLPALAFLFYDLYKYFANRFVVTNYRFIQKQGIYYIRITDWPLFKIDDVICIRNFVDRILGTGSVILIGISIPKPRLKDIGHPFELRNAIYSQLPTK